MLLMYDVTNQQSFEEIDKWNREISPHCSPRNFRLLIGNKTDLSSARVVSTDEGKVGTLLPFAPSLEAFCFILIDGIGLVGIAGIG